MERHNEILLVNETVQVLLDGTPFTITGLDDFIECVSCFADAVKKVGKQANHLLLVHSPLQQEMVFREMEKLNQERPAAKQIDLQYIFASHTHGVPVWPDHAGKYLQSWHNSHKPYLYVSKGFGTVMLPFRLGARAEITLFR